MSEEQKVTDEILNRLQSIEEDIKRIEQSKKRRTFISLGGAVLILIILALFGWNLYQFGQNAMSPEVKKEFLAEVSEDLVEIARDNPDVKRAVKDLRDDVLPHVIEQITKRFRENMPQFQREQEKVVVNLRHYLEHDVKDKLAASLARLKEVLEQEMLKKYPEVNPDEMKPILQKIMDIFIVETNAIIEKRLYNAYLSLGELSETVNQFGRLEETKKFDPKNLDYVKLQMIEAMLELAIYHINPARGDAPAGGA
jgi:hypothetical protein